MNIETIRRIALQLAELQSELDDPENDLVAESTLDLCEAGYGLARIREAANRSLLKLEAEGNRRMDENGGDLLVHDYGEAHRKWKNEYSVDVDLLASALPAGALDALLEWVPAYTPPPAPTVPGHWRVRNTTKLVNYIEKQGNTERAQLLTEALGRVRVPAGRIEFVVSDLQGWQASLDVLDAVEAAGG